MEDGFIMNVDVSGFEQFKRHLEELRDNGIDELCRELAKELAARLLAKVIKRTPVGDYNSEKVGGTLRRGWHIKQESGSDGVNSIKVNSYDCNYVVEVVNNVEYAVYVEYGHRTVNHTGWVNGQFMLTISVHEIEQIAPRLIERRLEEKIRKALNG